MVTDALVRDHARKAKKRGRTRRRTARGAWPIS